MKKTVLVLFGGNSSEHDISRRSVTSVLENIDKTSYTPVVVGISKMGQWYLYSGDTGKIIDGAWETDTENLAHCVLSTNTSFSGLLILDGNKFTQQTIDVIFPVLHGKNGEDGTMQGLFEIAGIPYVGCKVLASAACMDKDCTKKILAQAGIPVSAGFTLYKQDKLELDAVKKRVESLGFPVFVKPANAGSSVGVSKVDSMEQLEQAISTAFLEDSKLLIEQGVKGAEVECAVMGNNHPVPSSVLGEIAPQGGVYDFQGKYQDDSAALYIPARISTEQKELVTQTAIKAYKALGCSGLSRVDFFAVSDGTIVLNEINTMPGFTNISMFPKLFMNSGKEYSQIINDLIDYAFQ